MKNVLNFLALGLFIILSSCSNSETELKNSTITNSNSHTNLSRLAYQFGTGMQGYNRLEPLIYNGVTYQNWTLTCPKSIFQPFNYTCHYFRELNGDVTVGMAHLNKGEFEFKSSLVNNHMLSISITNFYDNEDEIEFLNSGIYKIWENQIYDGSLLSNVDTTIYFQEGEYEIQPPRNSSEKAYIEIPLVY